MPKQTKNTDSGMCGNDWYPICIKCHAEVKECCIDVELSLFPDEIDPFIEKDPENFKRYHDGTFGYIKEGKCIFLNDQFQCELQLKGIEKPVDCIIYPINYKNGKVFLDTSCWAKELLNVDDAIIHLQKKIEKFPQYQTIEYEVRDSDIFVMELPVV